MIELKDYQHKAVNALVKQSRNLLKASGNDKALVFKAPTGSGKTIMMAEFLQRLTQEEFPSNYVFVWTSLYDLHSQSKAKLDDYLRDSRYNLLTLEQLTNNALNQDSVLFVNWHSLTTTKASQDSGSREWSNVFVKEREDGRSIVDVLAKTRDAGKEIILIVDEAHRNYFTENSQRFISEAVKPKLTIEVSATPLIKVDVEELESRKKGFVGVPFEDVVSSGLIKQETSINQNIGKFTEISKSADDLVIAAALAKRQELVDRYNANQINVNPLILIQLPSETKETSSLDVSVREEVEQQLAEQGITYENGKLAVWLSGEQTNLELIEKNTSEVEALIFKEAVAVGWDCPRAQILVMLRAIRSLTFEIQTVGRILRMPEAKHYQDVELNKAFVFTNIASINVNNKPEDLDFFKTHFAHLKEGIENVSLPSIYLHRQDYGDLTASFSKILVQTLNSRFGIEDADMVNQAYEKADKELELYPEELKTPLLADVLLHNLDAIQEELGSLNIEKIQADVSDANIQREFDYILKAWCLPYAPVRSFTKLKTAFYKWFALIGFEQGKWNDIQRIIACSSVNQKIFHEVVETAKKSFELVKPTELASRKTATESIFALPEIGLFGEKYELVSASKYAFDKCYLRSDRSEPERYFEDMLERSSSVKWWYKNGEGQQQFFSVAYQTKDEETQLIKAANFYPDYIVKYNDGAIGIYDTKSGNTITDSTTYDKSNSLWSFINKQKEQGKEVSGGILNKRQDGLFIFDKDKYTPNLSEWEKFQI